MKKSTLIIEAILIQFFLMTAWSVAYGQVTIVNLNPSNYWRADHAQTLGGWTTMDDVDTVETEAELPPLDWPWIPTNAGQAPQWQSNVQNGKSGIYFSATDNLRASPTEAVLLDWKFFHGDTASAFTFYMVAKKDGDEDNITWLFMNNARTATGIEIRLENRSGLGHNDALFVRHKVGNLALYNETHYENAFSVDVAHSITITYTPSDSMRIYVDGLKINAEKAIMPNISARATNDTGILPHYAYNGGITFKGWIFESAHWNRVVDPDSIQQFVYDNYAIGSDPGLGGGGSPPTTNTHRRGILATYPQ